MAKIMHKVVFFWALLRARLLAHRSPSVAAVTVKSLIFLASFCQIAMMNRSIVLLPVVALCIKGSNCKLPSRKGAPLIAVKRLELTSVIRQDSCHFEWALRLRLEKFGFMNNDECVKDAFMRSCEPLTFARATLS